MEELFSARVPKSSTEVRKVFIHDIEEGGSVGQQEQQVDKRDDEEGDEVKGVVDEIRSNAHSAHETWRWLWDEWRLKLEPVNVRASDKEDSQRTTTLTDNKKRDYEDLQCMMAHALASTTLTNSPSVSGHFTHWWDFRSVLRVVNSICRCTNLFNFWPVREFLVEIHTAKTGLRCCLHPLSVTVDRRQL